MCCVTSVQMPLQEESLFQPGDKNVKCHSLSHLVQKLDLSLTNWGPWQSYLAHIL